MWNPGYGGGKGVGVKSAAGAFFAQLPHDVLDRREVLLVNLLKGVANAMQDLLPRGVSLQEWAQERIPNESAAAINGSGLVYVAPHRPRAPRFPGGPAVNQPLVAQKGSSMAGKGQLGGNVGKGQSLHVPGVPQAPGSGPVDAQKGQGKGQPVENGAPSEATVAFLSSLPQDGFTPDEEVLRTAILDFLSDEKRCIKQTVLDSIRSQQHINELVKRCLPKKVKLKDWIEHRIGGEVDIEDESATGKVFIQIKMNPHERKQAWFRSLPEGPGALSHDEQKIKNVMVKLISNWSPFDAKGKERSPDPPLNIITQDAEIRELATKILKKFPFREWIEKRMSHVFELDGPQNSGQYLVRLVPGALDKKDDSSGTREERREAFLDGLPDDGFTEQEDSLRNAVLDFLTSWTEPYPPTFQTLGSNQEIHQAKKEFLFVPGRKKPECTIQEWIERRIGGEVDILPDASGKMRLGLAGQLDVSNIPESELQDQNRKKGKDHDGANAGQPKASGHVPKAKVPVVPSSQFTGQKRKAEVKQEQIEGQAQKVARLSPMVKGKGSSKGGAPMMAIGNSKGAMGTPPKWGKGK